MFKSKYICLFIYSLFVLKFKSTLSFKRLMNLVIWINVLWSAPIQIGSSIYFMSQELQGGTVFVVIGIMILVIPLFGVVGVFMKKFQLQQMEQKDKRIKLMNEILSGIKVLKLYSWEPSFMKQVQFFMNKVFWE